MTSIPAANGYEAAFKQAIQSFWTVRSDQAEAQRLRGVSDRGTRGAVTGGGHLNPIATLIAQVFADAGMPPPSTPSRTLPGYYRASKSWDGVIVERDHLVSVIELKSQVGSFGNNQNNRIEEMLGQARDIERAAFHHLLGPLPPWFGYLLVLEDHPHAQRTTRLTHHPSFQPDPVFLGASYTERYRIAFERMRFERDLDAACLVVTNSETQSCVYPDASMTFTAFAAAIQGRVIQMLGVLGSQPELG